MGTEIGKLNHPGTHLWTYFRGPTQEGQDILEVQVTRRKGMLENREEIPRRPNEVEKHKWLQTS